MLHAIKPKLLMKILPKSELFLISNMFIWDTLAMYQLLVVSTKKPEIPQM